MTNGAAPVPGDRKLVVLGRESCVLLLRRVSLGRIAFVTQGRPTLLPVNFALLGDDVVVRTGTGQILETALHRSVVAFEADGWDAERSSWWSVVVTGVGEELTRPSDLAAVAELGLEPVAPGPRGHVVRIKAESVTGRWLPQSTMVESVVGTPGRPFPLPALHTVTEAVAAAQEAHRVLATLDEALRRLQWVVDPTVSALLRRLPHEH